MSPVRTVAAEWTRQVAAALVRCFSVGECCEMLKYGGQWPQWAMAACPAPSGYAIRRCCPCRTPLHGRGFAPAWLSGLAVAVINLLGS